MAKAVVDDLEPVDVQVQQRELPLLVAPDAGDRAFHAITQV
jgi:hypothetical protein